MRASTCCFCTTEALPYALLRLYNVGVLRRLQRQSLRAVSFAVAIGTRFRNSGLVDGRPQRISDVRLLCDDARGA
jgi:hypothetical protein